MEQACCSSSSPLYDLRMFPAKKTNLTRILCNILCTFEHVVFPVERGLWRHVAVPELMVRLLQMVHLRYKIENYYQ